MTAETPSALMEERSTRTESRGGVPAMSVNLVPLPYSRIAVQRVDFALSETELRSFLRGKETWFETDYVVFRRGNDCAVAEVQKAERKDLFCRIMDVELTWKLPQYGRVRNLPVFRE
jgi:hypothetical protein